MAQRYLLEKTSRQNPEDPFKTHMQIRKAQLNLCIRKFLLNSYQADFKYGLSCESLRPFLVAIVFITNLQNTQGQDCESFFTCAFLLEVILLVLNSKLL